MGSLFTREYYIDKAQVEHTIRTGAQRSDILSKATLEVLDVLPAIDCGTLESFKHIVRSYRQGLKKKQVAYIATPCALAVYVHNRYSLNPKELTDIIFNELNLPWIVTQ